MSFIQKKYICTVGLAFFIVLIAVTNLTAIPISAVGEVTMYVDATASDDSAIRTEGAVYKTLNMAVNNSVSGDTIIIRNSIELTQTVTIPSPKELTIKTDGASEIVRGGSHEGALIIVNAGAILTLDGVIVDGGALWNANVNSGKTAFGSLITVYGKLIVCSGAILRNNDVIEFSGGLVSVRDGGHMIVDDGYFYGGSAVNGGAILVMNGNSRVELKKGIIHDNQATGDMGGAMTIINTSGEVVVEDSVSIYNNKVLGGSGGQGHGGATYIQNGTLTIDGGDIYNNYAGGVSGGYGGAISMNGGTINMISGSIRNNESEHWGGAIYFGASSNGSTFNMKDGSISDNIAKTNGGAIYSYNPSSTYNTFANILGGSITGNRTTTEGSNSNSDAIFSGGELRLNMEAEIEGAIHLHDNGTPTGVRVITLVNVPVTPYDYLISTHPSSSADGRVVVVPGSIVYGGKTYTNTDAEPYVTHFKHVTKAVVQGSVDLHSSMDTTYLILSGFSVNFDLNKPAESAHLVNPLNIASIVAADGEVIASISGFPNPPTLNGYTFMGWTLDKAGNIPLTSTEVIAGSGITLYAQWKIDDPLPQTPSVPNTPNTGDASSIDLWLMLILAGVVYSSNLLIRYKQEN